MAAAAAVETAGAVAEAAGRESGTDSMSGMLGSAQEAVMFPETSLGASASTANVLCFFKVCGAVWWWEGGLHPNATEILRCESHKWPICSAVCGSRD